MKDTTKTNTDITMEELDDLLKESDGISEYDVKEARRRLKLANQYGGPQKVLVADVVAKHMDLKTMRLLLDTRELVITKDKRGKHNHDNAFIQAASLAELAALRKTISTYCDIAVIDKSTNEVIAINNGDND